MKHTDEYLHNLGQRIKAFRKKAGYTSSEKFAYDKGINRSQYGKYEVGINMRYKTLMKIIKALDTTPAEFFSEGFEVETVK